jgi:uncharacterized DUF497 family protein
VTLDFEWDERKRQQVIKERDVDMLYAALIFENPVLQRIDDRNNYGETRYISIGLVENECFVVVHTLRKNVTRLITAWKGGRDERYSYEQSLSSTLAKNEE